MAQLGILRRLLVAGTFMTTLAMAATTAAGDVAAASAKTSHAATAENVSVEAGAIGLLGSAAWLLGGRLRKRLQPPN
jgi:hypothetical protein